MRGFVALVLFGASALGAPSLSHQHHQHLHNAQKPVAPTAEHATVVTQTNTLYRRDYGDKVKSNDATAENVPRSSGGNLPFSRMVAFGDNLSDNGNGSCAHGVAGDPETIYGFGTWTNGPVAVSYLAEKLSIPLAENYAFGHADGGSKFGATVDNDFTKSDADAPSAMDQISNYTSGNYQSDVGNTLHFLWIGNNDVLPFLPDHIFFGSSDSNEKFASDLADKITEAVEKLIHAGAGSVFLPNIYPRQEAPVTRAYFTNDTSDVHSYADTIDKANTNLKSNVAKFGDKVIYHDVNGFMKALWSNADAFGFTHTDLFKDYCDGAINQAVAGESNWDLCQKDQKANEFYWMQFLDPTTKVHEMIAEDMAQAVKGHFS
ncbi:MAG: hypothetical protein M1831_000880 [Alyxoria varia]|nr:MAG: hypothetical protein M1831_000880 [Alyxoria varia]